jgi:transcriptional regulator with XRE-family HTH domain
MPTRETELYKIVGSKIKSYREENGMTQQSLADLCEMEKANISRIERGCTNLTLKTLYKLSVSLNVEIKDLVDINN